MIEYIKKRLSDFVILAFIIIAVILLTKSCSPVKHDTNTIVKHSIDTVIVTDTIHSVDTIELTKYVTKAIEIEVPVYVDTNTVIDDYYTHKYRVDTSKVGSSFIVINTWLYKNDIEKMKLDWNVLTQTKYITDKITVEVPKNGWFVGGGAYKSFNNKMISPEIILGYDIKNWKIYSSVNGYGGSLGIIKKLRQ